MAYWTPTQHTIVLAGVLVAAVLVASVAIARRDVWLEEVRRHRKLLRRAAFGGLVAIGVALLIAHHEELEELLGRIDRGDLFWLLAAVALEAVSFGGYMLLAHDVFHPRAERLTWLPSVEPPFSWAARSSRAACSARCRRRSAWSRWRWAAR